VVGGH